MEVKAALPPDKYKRQVPPSPTNFDPIKGEYGCMIADPEKVRLWDEDQWGLYRWMYHRLTESVDAEIGQVLDALDRSGLKDNTIIVFTSDHGDMGGSHQMVGKGTPFEECLTVPFIFVGKGIKKGGCDTETLVCNGWDFIPTICDLTGVPYANDLDGISLAPLLTGKGTFKKREYVFMESAVSFVVSDGKMKYAVFEAPGNPELFVDLKNDPGETVNLDKDPRYDALKQRYKAVLLDHLRSKNWELLDRRATMGQKFQ